MFEATELYPHHQEMSDAYASLRDQVAKAANSSSPTKADDILALVYGKLVSDRPDYFTQVIEGYGAEIATRRITDVSTLRLLFNTIVGQSPLNGTPLAA